MLLVVQVISRELSGDPGIAPRKRGTASIEGLPVQSKNGLGGAFLNSLFMKLSMKLLELWFILAIGSQ